MPTKWTQPKALFNGKDLTGWEPIGNVANNKWIARDGELVNDNPEVAGQTRAGRGEHQDHGEVPGFQAAHRGRIAPKAAIAGSICAGGTNCRWAPKAAQQPTHEMGAIYSHYPPPAGAENGLGKWTSLRRHVGGPARYGSARWQDVSRQRGDSGSTGGALDSNEAEPGPFFLQGDHHGVIRYRNITISVPAK